MLPSGPHDAWFLTHDEKLVAVWRVSENQTGIKNPKIQLYQAKEALLEPRVWFLAIQQLSIGIINGSITNFQSALLKGFGFSSSRTILYQLPNGAFQIICTVACGAIATYVPNSLILTTAASLLPPFAGMIGVHLISLDHQLALAACCWLFAVVGAAIILNWSVVASNFAGHTKRMTVNGLNFVFYYGGNIIGPFLFIPAEAPRYPTALKALIGMFVCLIVSTLAIGALMVMENRRRDGIAAAAGESRHESSLQVAGADGFMDHTDKEMGTFRYRV